MRKGFAPIFVLVAIGVSLALTAAYTVTVNKNVSTDTQAQTTTCDAVGTPCCSTPESAITGEKICRGSYLKCVNSVCQHDDQKVVDSNVRCSTPDGREGKCMHTVGEDICRGNAANPTNEFVAGLCPGSSTVQCCVAKAASQPPPQSNPQNNPPADPPVGSGASCSNGVLCNGQGGQTAADGASVCGGNNITYTCRNGSWTTANQGCACPNPNPPSTATSTGKPTETSCLKPLLRYYNGNSHFYTSNWSEFGAGGGGWTYEGYIGYVQATPNCFATSTVALNRFVKIGTDLHYYSTNPALPDASWQSEGAVGYVNTVPDGSKHTTVIDRFYNPSTQDHFYTSWPAESANLKANGGGYVFEHSEGFTYGDQALFASQPVPVNDNPSQQSPPVQQNPPGGGPATIPTVELPGGPVTSTGGGTAGYQGFTRYFSDCSNGFSGAATYTAVGGDATKPNVYYNVEAVTGPEQAGLQKGQLLAQAVMPNGMTFSTQNTAWEAAGKQIKFYVYTIPEGGVPAQDYTIHGMNGTQEVSAPPNAPPPQPYVLACPGNVPPPPGPGEGNGFPPPVLELPPEDVGSTVKKEMEINVQIFMPTTPDGGAGGTPAGATLPVDVTVTNGARGDDRGSATVNMTHMGEGRWLGKYNTMHVPGTRFSITVWPKKHVKKTFCAVGPLSPHVIYPDYSCTEDMGTIVLKSGQNFLNFSTVRIGAGDLNSQKVRDGVVDAQDLLQLNLFMQQPDRNDAEAADLNFDGVVNRADYDLAVWSLTTIPQ